MLRLRSAFVTPTVLFHAKAITKQGLNEVFRLVSCYPVVEFIRYGVFNEHQIQAISI